MGHETMRFAGPVGALFFGVLSAAIGLQFAAHEDPHERRLWKPLPVELEAERNGQVFIYEGLPDAAIEAAMDAQFERIDAMMFLSAEDAATSPARSSCAGWARATDPSGG